MKHHITFIQPAVGHKPDQSAYPKTWIMEPLAIATLSALTPESWKRTFFDDRLREVDYTIETDAVCITVECYTAKRSYQIATEFRRRGRKIIMGGFHTALAPNEVARHADAIVLCEAESVWAQVLEDIADGTLKPVYDSARPSGFSSILPDRSIFGQRNYGPLALLETSRGCRFECEFCSITKFFRKRYTPRPICDVLREIEMLSKNILFFVDDNLAMDIDRLKTMCIALIPLRKHWVAQLSIHAAMDLELLALMRKSGCAGVLIGFESLDGNNLSAMGKTVNSKRNFSTAIANLRKYNLSIYATFVFGYDHDTPETFRKTLDFALESKFFFAAFNHLVPFPGTDVYRRLESEGRLISPAWHLDDSVHFGDVVFRPKNFTAQELSELCMTYRRNFYSFPSIVRRGADFRANSHGLLKACFFYHTNITQKFEIARRHGLPNGDAPL